MKKKLLSLLMVTALTASLVAGCGSNGDSKDKSSGSDRETKDVSELVIGEIEYSVIDDGGWAQSMHEGLVKACEDLGIDTKTNLLTMEEISEEDTSLIESTVEELVDEGADSIRDVLRDIRQSLQSFSRNTRMLSSHSRVTMFMITSLSSRSVDMREIS